MSDDLGDLDDLEDYQLPTFTKEDVEKDLRDWKERLRALFQEVHAWAQENDWRVDASGTVVMHEDLMQEVGVPATDQPLLRLDRGQSYALFMPRGPWVLNANGMIDLYTSKGTFVIVDLAERGSAPRWTIFRASKNRDGDLFKPEMIANLV